MNRLQGVAMASEHVVTADDGVHLHLQRWGQGPSVLVLHGLGYASWAVEPLAQLLADRFAVWSLDTRGAGRSDQPPGPYSIAGFAEDAACALQLIEEQAHQQTGGRVHLLGYSMGGYTAQILALEQPHLLRTLTLMSTSAGGPGALDVPVETRNSWERHADLGPEAFARSTMPYSLARGWPQAHPQQFEQLLAERLRHPTSARAWRAQFDASAAFVRAGVPAEQIAVPTLVIHGNDDRVVPAANGRLLHARVPSSTLIEIDGGHLIHLENPQRIAEIFTAFTSTEEQTH